jgi:hypothetical protein
VALATLLQLTGKPTRVITQGHHGDLDSLLRIADSARVTVAPFREAVSRISFRYAARGGCCVYGWAGSLAAVTGQVSRCWPRVAGPAASSAAAARLLATTSDVSAARISEVIGVSRATLYRHLNSTELRAATG